MTPDAKDVGDLAAIGAATGTVFQFLPEIAALLAIIWTAIRIYEWARIRVFGREVPPIAPEAALDIEIDEANKAKENRQ